MLLSSKRYKQELEPIKESDQPAHPCADPVGAGGPDPPPLKSHKI